jgi:GNAT superfamily N-acetyltransferase
MEIRPPHPFEYERLRQFAAHSFRVAYEHLNEPVAFEAYMAQHFSVESFLEELRHPGVVFWTAWESDQLLGYCKVWPLKPLAELGMAPATEIERIYVDPAMLGRQIGRQLLDFCKAYARSLGSEWLYLGVWTENPRAIAFYQRNGLEIFGECDFYVGEERQTDWWMGVRL